MLLRSFNIETNCKFDCVFVFFCKAEASCPDEKTELIFQDLILNSVDWLLCEDLVFFWWRCDIC